MDAKKTGGLIADARVERGMTQRELAERLMVTDKAVSRWETGRGFPDISLLPELSKALDLTVAELVNGERSAENMTEKSTDSAVMEAFRYSCSMAKRTLAVVLIVAGIVIIRFTQNGAVANYKPLYPILGIAVSLFGVVLLIIKRRENKKSAAGGAGISPVRAGIAAFAITAATIVLEALPYGVALRGQAGPTSPVTTKLYSYFSLYAAFGTGVTFPLESALLTVIAAVLLALSLAAKMREPGMQNAAFICTVVAALLSLANLIMFEAAVIGAVITLALAVSALMQALANRFI